MAQPIRIRPAIVDDAASIAAIYNQGIVDRVATFETALRSDRDVRKWLKSGDEVLVAAVGGGVNGFARLSAYRDRDCYRGVREVSVYIARLHRRHGVGRSLLLRMIDLAAERGYWKLVSRIFVENVASRALVRRLGFREVGVYRRHGQLDGAWRDVVIVERLIGANARPAESPVSRIVSDRISALARYYQLRNRDRTCRHGLTVSECYALEAVAAGGGVGILDLGARLGLNKSSASRVADALIAAGLAKVSTGEDRRRKIVTATRRGAELVRRIHDEIRVEHERVLRQFDDVSLSSFAEMLESLDRVPERCRR